MKLLKQTIIPTTKKAGWIEARRMTKDKGGLPSHLLLDDYLVRTENWHDLLNDLPMEIKIAACHDLKERLKGLDIRECLTISSIYKLIDFRIWARELLIHPEEDGQFKKGEDVFDSQKDKKGRIWILPADQVPEEAIGRKRVGLLIDPEDVSEGNGRVVVHPRSSVLLDRFIQEPGKDGKVNEQTRMPQEIKGELWNKLSKDEKRRLFRINGIGLKPIFRRLSLRGGRMHLDIHANYLPDSELCVMHVE
jgi:hypothetical protein